jgi:hypothetical protein
MAENYGNNVSNVLETLKYNFSNVVWQAGKPPLDSELNLVGQVNWENQAEHLRNTTHSGFLLDPLRAQEDFFFYEESSNYFEINRGLDNPLVALVNGWVVPVIGCNSSDGVKNVITLPPPPTTEARTDIVFLEVWRAVVSPNDSTNKPEENAIYPYGNVQYTHSSLADEMVDANVGFETTKRVQVQYRLRVTEGNNSIEEYLEGLGASDLYAQGTSNLPVMGYTFSNMGEELGDVGLWRAGSGDAQSKTDLGSVDGYVYSIPVCAVFRRNSGGYTAVELNSLHPSHNGSVTRTPSGTKGLLQNITLLNTLGASDIGNIQVQNLIGSGFDDVLFFEGGDNLFAKIGDGLQEEIVKLDGISTANSTISVVSRGHGGTQAKPHQAGTSVKRFIERSDNLYADQVHQDDLLDLRHAVNIGSWDYTQLLNNAVSDLLTNNLRTTMKQAGTGSFSKGTVIEEVSVFSTDNTFTYCTVRDQANAVRTVWSDASAFQSDITCLIDLSNSNPLDAQGLDVNRKLTWTIGADFQPRGFFTTGRTNGTCLFFKIGGESGTGGLRYGINQNQSTVRFVSPREMEGRFNPFKIFFPDYNRPNAETEAGDQGLYTSPTKESDFEEPFIVLGSSFLPNTTSAVLNTQIFNRTFNGEKIWVIKTNTNYTNVKDNLVLNGSTTLSRLITDEGKYPSGFYSQAYLVAYGDDDQETNNGCFKIIGASDITPINSSLDAPMADVDLPFCLFLKRVGSSNADFANSTATLSLEMRTQRLDSRDNDSCIVFTSVEDVDTNHNFPDSADREVDMVLSTSVLWPPAHGAMSRTLDSISRVGIKNISQSFVRNAPAGLDQDTAFNFYPENEIYLPTENHISTWSRLSSEGMISGEGGSANYGGNIVNGEIDKEAEAFYDLGSKTLVLRPISYQSMKIYRHDLATVDATGSAYAGWSSNPNPPLLDNKVYLVPHEVMPRFGRQDIPYHVKTGATDLFMEGINHLFSDTRNNNANNVFNIIGGQDNGGQSVINPIFFSTNHTYGNLADISTGNINTKAYGAEKAEIVNLPTTDFGTVLRGVKLPPFFGIARVYGVYELNDLISSATNFNGSCFESDRETFKSTISAKNLLRKDADSYTLYIQKGGGDALTGEEDCHTYILTEHAIDISLIPTYTPSNKFSDFNYVVECVVFGFGRGFINKNNFVLSRRYAGDGSDISADPSHLNQVPMVVPSAVDQSEIVYVSGRRTVYQGDPFYTIGGSNIEISDSPYREGQVLSSNSYYLSERRDQLDSAGASAIDIPNRRTYEVLASLDFYTTFGSGSIGGSLYKNTVVDVGYSSKIGQIPSSNAESIPQNNSGLFTQSNVELSKSKCSLILKQSYLGLYSNLGEQQKKLVIQMTESGVVYEFSFSAGTENTLNDYVDEIVDYFKNLSVSVEKVQVVRNETTPSDEVIALIFTSNLNGEEGNASTLEVYIADVAGNRLLEGWYATRLYSGRNISTFGDVSTPQKVNFAGGASLPANGGVGNNDISLVGMTSRLPLGVLVSDHDFLCEDPLRDGSKSLQTLSSKLTSLPSTVGVSPTGAPYTKIVGATGELLQAGDGDVENWIAFNVSDNPTGTRKYRIHRGGGAVFGASGNVPGAPLSWLNDSFGEESRPILKGGILSCRAMLVRNFKETAFSGSPKDRTYGDEVQMLIVTQGVFKNGKDVRIAGEISPSGFGEGYASSDRYRISGRPLVKGNSPDISPVSPAEYNKG